jgi:hypothetical protein
LCIKIILRTAKLIKQNWSLQLISIIKGKKRVIFPIRYGKRSYKELIVGLPARQKFFEFSPLLQWWGIFTFSFVILIINKLNSEKL